jgi:hypothetical protein
LADPPWWLRFPETLMIIVVLLSLQFRTHFMAEITFLEVAYPPGLSHMYQRMIFFEASLPMKSESTPQILVIPFDLAIS